ncbi:MAG TPA: twin-arginine translocation signal domain-containing protein [Candidatus Dormibacteraeota bacterium]|nr:twin-arginine translocation signal domain-containing protein [Candidatus Dormibacteraeota bacterium]
MNSTDVSSALRHSAISRRTFLGAAAVATGVVAAGLRAPLALAAHGSTPTVFPLPIPGGVSPFGIFIHHFPPVPLLGPGPINEPSQITDFNGLVGVCRVTGSGTRTDTSTGMTSRLNFQVDNGFMSGLYVGEDGREHHGTFAFV